MSDDKSKIQDFKVVDKRASRQEAEAGVETKEKDEPRKATASTKKFHEEAKQQAGHEVNFTSFVFSLSTQALIDLGELPDPTGGKREENLTSAKQAIDILGIIREKTQGNLKPEEAMLLEDWLYELRMKYLEKTKSIKL